MTKKPSWQERRDAAFGSPLPTPEEAQEAGRTGWNLRCNSCGGYGAVWVPEARPGWGSLALCWPHKAELEAMQQRHASELKTLTTINYEQHGKVNR